jgi:hypothetical protein
MFQETRTDLPSKQVLKYPLYIVPRKTGFIDLPLQIAFSKRCPDLRLILGLLDHIGTPPLKQVVLGRIQTNLAQVWRADSS